MAKAECSSGRLFGFNAQKDKRERKPSGGAPVREVDEQRRQPRARPDRLGQEVAAARLGRAVARRRRAAVGRAAAVGLGVRVAAVLVEACFFASRWCLNAWRVTPCERRQAGQTARAGSFAPVATTADRPPPRQIRSLTRDLALVVAPQQLEAAPAVARARELGVHRDAHDARARQPREVGVLLVMMLMMMLL